MHRVLTRTLMVGSVAPMVLLAVAGGASAESDFDYGNQDGDTIYASCSHDRIEEFGYNVEIDLDGEGQAADSDDVEAVRVIASNNFSNEGFTRAGAQVSSLRVDLYRSDFTKIDEHVNQPRTPALTVTDSTNNFKADGDIIRTADIDNISYAVVRVDWSATPDAQGPETLTCTIKFPNPPSD